MPVPRHPAPAPPPRDTALLVHLALVTVQLLFGANYVIAKVAFHEVSPEGLVLIRSVGAALALALALPFRRRDPARPRLTAREYGALFLYSLLGITINQAAFLEGLARSSATNAAIILVMIPVVTLAFAVLLRRERASVVGTAGIGAGLVGALLMILPRGGVTLSSTAVAGNLLLLLCASAYALYLVLARRILARHDTLTVVVVMFVMSAIVLTPFGYAGVRDVARTGLTAAGWWSVTFVTLGATAAPYLLNGWALGRAKSSVVAVYVLLQPIVAAVLGRIFLGERLGANAALAATLIVGGVLATVWRPVRPVQA